MCPTIILNRFQTILNQKMNQTKVPSPSKMNYLLLTGENRVKIKMKLKIELLAIMNGKEEPFLLDYITKRWKKKTNGSDFNRFYLDYYILHHQFIKIT